MTCHTQPGGPSSPRKRLAALRDISRGTPARKVGVVPNLGVIFRGPDFTRTVRREERKLRCGLQPKPFPRLLVAAGIAGILQGRYLQLRMLGPLHNYKKS